MVRIQYSREVKAGRRRQGKERVARMGRQRGTGDRVRRTSRPSPQTHVLSRREAGQEKLATCGQNWKPECICVVTARPKHCEAALAFFLN